MHLEVFFPKMYFYIIFSTKSFFKEGLLSMTASEQEGIIYRISLCYRKGVWNRALKCETKMMYI